MDCRPQLPIPQSVRGLVCPPNSTTAFLRFIGKVLGIQVGANIIASMDISNFFMPLDTYMQTSIALIPPTPAVKINPPRLNLGERREIQRLELSDDINTWNITQATFSIKMPDVISPSTFSLDMFPKPFESPVQTLNNVYIVNTIKDWITNPHNPLYVDLLNKKIEVAAVGNIIDFKFMDMGVEAVYTLDIHYTTNESPVNEEYQIQILPIVTQSHIRYPNGAYKSIFILSQFWDVENNFIEWAWDEDIRNNDNNPESSNVQWRKMGPIFSLSGINDYKCSDMNMIQPIWVRNLYNCRTDLNVLVTS